MSGVISSHSSNLASDDDKSISSTKPDDGGDRTAAGRSEHGQRSEEAKRDHSSSGRAPIFRLPKSNLEDGESEDMLVARTRPNPRHSGDSETFG